MFKSLAGWVKESEPSSVPKEKQAEEKIQQKQQKNTWQTSEMCRFDTEDVRNKNTGLMNKQTKYLQQNPNTVCRN